MEDERVLYDLLHIYKSPIESKVPWNNAHYLISKSTIVQSETESICILCDESSIVTGLVTAA